MADSYQKEIPKARVNITLDLETDGAKKKKELPFKMLVLGDFSQGKTQGPVELRERINVDKNNLDNVIAELNPELNFNVENTIKKDGSEMPIHLSVKSLKDFEPTQIVRQVPALRKLIAMRNLLKDLRSNVLDNQSFRKELEKIVADAKKLAQFKLNINEAAPLEAIDNE